MKQSFLFKQALLIVTGIALTACDQTPQQQVEEPLRPVRTIIASSSDGIDGRDFPGVVVARNKADLSFRVSGKLKSLLIKEGDEVVTGQILAVLDKTDFEITLEDKKASYEKTKANFERSAKLLEPGHISQREFDDIKAGYSTATAQLKSAEQNLIYTELKAPFTGGITKSYVDNFEQIMAHSPIATLQDLKLMEIEIDVPESIMIRVKRDKDQREIHAYFDAIKDKKFPLTVREVSTQADDTTHAYKVRLSMLDIGDYTILPGMTATVIANVKHPVDSTKAVAIVIPSHAVLEDNNGRFVFVATAETIDAKTATVHRINIETGRLTNFGLEVTKGLEVNDQVVIAGMSKMHEGMRVRLMTSTSH